MPVPAAASSVTDERITVIHPVTNAFVTPIADPTLKAAQANRGPAHASSSPTPSTVTHDAFVAPVADPTLEAAKANRKGQDPALVPKEHVITVAPNAFAAPTPKLSTAPHQEPPATSTLTPAPSQPLVTHGDAFGTPASSAPAGTAVSGQKNAFAPATPPSKASESGTVPTPVPSPTPSTPTPSPSTAAAPGVPPKLKVKPKQLLVSLTLNGQDLGLQFVLKVDDRILVDDGAFKNNNAQGQSNNDVGLVRFRNRQFVDPVQRFPGATIKLSSAEDKLTITLPGSAFGKQRIQLNQLAPIVPLTTRPSTFVNYSLGESNTGVGSAYLDGGVSVGTWLFHSSGSWSAASGWLRGVTSLQKDDPKHLRRWTLGDQFVYSSDGLGGGASIAGIGLQRAFDLDPYLITLPQPNLSGVLQAPGLVDVYRNGVLVAQRQVGAGPFSLEQLGIGVGQNNVRMVIHDPFGGTRELSQSFYAVSNNLAKGLTEYSYQLGINSPTPGQQYQTNRPVLLARQRWGVNSWLTAGYRLEAEKELENGGFNSDLRLPFGGLHLAAATSRASTGARGKAINFSYTMSGQRWSAAVGGTAVSKGYRRLGDSALEQLLAQLKSGGYLNPVDPNNPFAIPGPNGQLIDPTNPAQSIQAAILAARLQRQAYATFSYSPLQRLIFQATATRSTYADGRTDKVFSVGANLDLSWASLYLGYDKTRVMNTNDRVINLTMTIPLGNDTATYSHLIRKDGSSDSADFQRSLPADTGIGYAVHLERAPSGLAETGDFQAQNRLGRLNAQVYNTPLGRSGNVQLAGSVVLIDHEVHFGRPLTSGYALVRVGDGLKGVPVIHENQPIGKTGSSGSLLVTDLLPYQNNQIGFDQSAVPAAYTMSQTETLVNVPRSGGTVVDFHVRPLKAIRGILEVNGHRLGGGAIVDVEGTPTKTQRPEKRHLDPPSPMGSKGNFYLEDIPPGDWTLTALYHGRLARCPIMVPAHKAPVYRINDIHCAWTGVDTNGQTAPMIPLPAPTSTGPKTPAKGAVPTSTGSKPSISPAQTPQKPRAVSHFDPHSDQK